MKSGPFITVFTPTYNRADKIHRVYHSLIQQTFTDFEWVVVDDGSSDNTEELIQKWISEEKINIKYHYQENAGKHNAINKAVALAQGFLFVIADSDDAFQSNTLQVFSDTWNDIPEPRRAMIGGIWCLCSDENGSIIPEPFPASPIDLTYEERIYRFKITGEKWHAERLDVMKEFPFPEIKMPGLVISEGNIWRRINEKYLFRCINEPLRIYFHSEDGLMKQSLKKTKASLYTSWLNAAFSLDEELHYFLYKPKFFLMTALMYSAYSFELRKSPFAQRKWVVRLLLLLLTPLSIFFILIKSLKNGK